MTFDAMCCIYVADIDTLGHMLVNEPMGGRVETSQPTFYKS